MPAATRLSFATAAAALGLGALLVLAGCSGEQAPEYNLSNITGKMPDLRFRAPDAGGTMRTAADFEGKAVLVYFGFTHCPDACPMTLGRIRTALKRLPAETARQVAVLFVTVDPERDTPQRLRTYLGKFDMPQLTGLRPTGEAQDRLTERYHVHVKLLKEGPGDTDYGVDHSSQTFVFGPDGRARLMARLAGTNADSPEALAADLEKIL